MSEVQISFPLVTADSNQPNTEWLIEFLRGRDWMTAAAICSILGVPVTEGRRRGLRAAAEAADGRIAGGQNGYKLVDSMTKEEYAHYRNWMLSQTARMEHRIAQSDKIYFSKNPVSA